jgi:magnesium transporter
VVIDTVTAFIGQRRLGELGALLRDRHASDVVDLLRQLGRPERALVFRLLPRPLAADVFSSLDRGEHDALLRDLTDEETRQVLAGLSPDDRTYVLEELPGPLVQRLLNLLGPDDLREARQLLGYPEDSAGRLMTPDYVALRPAWMVAEALEHVRARGRESETIDVLYVVDEGWRLLGTVGLRHLILAPRDARIEALMRPPVAGLAPTADREEAVRLMSRYDLFALPVVDRDGVLLGIVTVDDVLDVAVEEATEDFHRTAAVAPLDASYRDTGPWRLYRKRVGWLIALVAANLVSSSVVAVYEETLAAAVALAFFIPLLIDSGGNVGTQSAAMLVRALATGDVLPAHWRRTLAKELLVGLALGVTLGAAGSALGMIRGGVEIGIVVGVSMLLIVIITNVLGVTLPLVLVRWRLDPAVASSPMITSIADSAGLAIYFAVATSVLGRFAGG